MRMASLQDKMKNDKNPAHFRECIAVGDVVVIVRKKDRPYLLETEGEVAKILTSKAPTSFPQSGLEAPRLVP